jgi:hypothetical protein
VDGEKENRSRKMKEKIEEHEREKVYRLKYRKTACQKREKVYP